jgi:hypothetical protein
MLAAAADPRDFLVRIIPILSIGAVSAATQTYDPHYPICLHVYGEVTYDECRYTSLAQCSESASSRAAQCEINPYDPPYPPPVGHHRHVRRDRAYEVHERGQIPVPAAPQSS